jgi:hypothetical protein
MNRDHFIDIIAAAALTVFLLAVTAPDARAHRGHGAPIAHPHPPIPTSNPAA